MARPGRICLPDHTYHVMSRCIEFKDLMKDPFYKELLLEVIKMTQEKYNFELSGYEIMHNHFHFIIKPLQDEASISKIMQYIKARYAEKYNKYTGRSGPFWNERFKCKIIEHSDNPRQYFLRLSWYMCYNPVRKNIVSNPRDSRYGSINCYLDPSYKSQVKITLHHFFIELGKTFAERVEKFLIYEKFYLEKSVYPN